MVRVLSVAGSFLTLEQQLQQNGNGYRRYHDKQYDCQEVPLFHHADRKSLVRDYQRDLSSGHHSNADPQGILPAVAERLRDKPAADDLSDKSNHNESQREPQQIKSESVERDVKTYTCKEHRSEQHVGADIHFARDILSVAEVAENYSRNICAGNVGNAEERFGEDALRIMRAVRFSAQLGFTVDPDTAEAAKKLAGTLSKISAERIQTELVKLLVSPHPDYLRYAWEYGITAVVLPEFDRTMETPQNNPHHCYNVGEHTLEALRNIEADKTLRLAALFHDFGKPQTHTTDADGIDHFHGHAKISAELANNIMHRLKFDNDTLNKVKVYVRYHDLRPELTEKSVRRAVSKVGADAFAEVLKLKMADTLAQSPKWQPEKKAYLKELTALYHTILEKQQCLCIKDLKISGKDLIEDGMKPGKEMGEILAKLLELVLEEPQRNEREWLIGKSRELRNTEG